MGALRTFVRFFILGRRRGLRARARRRVWSMVGFGKADPSAQASGDEPAPFSNAAADESIPDGFVFVANEIDVPPGELLEVFVDEVAIAIGNVDGRIFAIGNTCPHAGGPLGDGTIDGKQAVCPYHGWAFDLETGSCTLNESVSVPTYEVTSVDGRICIRP